MNKLFEHYIKGQNVLFKYAKGPSVLSGKEFHPFHEIIYFMDGDGEFISENFHCRVTPGTIIIIPKETFHQLILHGDKNDYCRCIFQFDDMRYNDEGMNQEGIIQCDTEMELLFQKLIKNIEDNRATVLLDAVLSLLLFDISHIQIHRPTKNAQNPVILKILEYINNNISSKITLEDIAKHCIMSPSSVGHIFKKEMNISIYRFIVKKRLINAYREIKNGKPAMLAAIECGFNDYSGFYKQYRKMFGKGPTMSNGKKTNIKL